MNNRIIGHTLAMLITSLNASAQATEMPQEKITAATCAGCHGANGIGISGEFPNLAGQKQAYLLKQLKAFKSGARKDPTMSTMAATLSEKDMQDLAAHFSNLPPTPATIHNNTATGKALKAQFPAPTYISMKKSGTLMLFPDTATWPGGPNMLYDAVTPDGRMVMATSPSTGTLYIFDARNGKQLAIIKVGKAPKGVKVSPDGKTAYVSNQGSSDISIIDLQKLTVTGSITTKEGPHNVRFTRDGKRAYVTLQGGAGIGVIDTRRTEMVRVIPVPGITGPHNLDLSADEKTAYVRDFVHNVAVLDLESGKVSKVIPVGNGHGGIDVTPDGRFAATAAIGDKIVSLIDTKTLSVTNVEVGKGPHGIRASKDSRWLYVTLTGENAIAIVDLKTMKLVNKIPSGKFPFWVAVPGNP
ncbi:YVTN family beta-propeller repeat protein [Thiolapillus sp.]